MRVRVAGCLCVVGVGEGVRRRQKHTGARHPHRFTLPSPNSHTRAHGTHTPGAFSEASSVQLRNTLRACEDEATRRAAYEEGLRAIGPFVARAFLGIVRERNALARKMGFEDYYDYKVRARARACACECGGGVCVVRCACWALVLLETSAATCPPAGALTHMRTHHTHTTHTHRGRR
jgi:hypothetical protein